MSAWMLGGQLLMQGVGALTAPKAPKVKAYEPLDQDMDEYLPGAGEMQGLQVDMAMSMMRGEIPDSVKDQVMMAAGERASRGGYSATSHRVENMTARDLGLTSLDLMEQGNAMARQLTNDA